MLSLLFWPIRVFFALVMLAMVFAFALVIGVLAFLTWLFGAAIEVKHADGKRSKFRWFKRIH